MKSAVQKQSGFAPMLKNVFRRNILSLILAPLITLLITSMFTTSTLSINPLSVRDITFEFSSYLAITLAVISFVIALIVVYTLYRELFSRRASDFLLAMPVKREAFFNANALFGVVIIVLSYVIPFAASVFLIKSDVIYPAKLFTFDVGVCAKLLLISFLASIAVLALFVVCAAISGRKWHYFVLSYFTVSSALGLSTGLTNYLDTIWGFMIEYDYSFVVSPVAAVTVSVDDKLNNMPAIIVALLALMAIMYTAGLIAFKRRKAEVAETTISGKILPFTIITIFLLEDAFTTLVLFNKLYINIIIAIVAMVLFTLIITALFYRKPFNKLTLTSLAASIAITAIVVCCVEFAPKATGYVDYVPETSEVESVTVKTNGNYVNMQSLGLFSDLFFGYYYDGLGMYNENEQAFNLSTEDAKSAVSALHKKMASEEAQDRFYDDETYEYDAVNVINLEYKLKNGKTVVRNYTINASIARDEFAAVLKTDECLDQISPINIGNGIIFVAVEHYDDTDVIYDYEEDYLEEIDEDYADVVNNYDSLVLDDYSALLDCIKKDFKKTDYDDVILSENGFDPEYYKQWSEDIVVGETEAGETGVLLAFYSFNENASEEEKAKMLKMRPEEMIDYDMQRVIESDYELDYLLENCSYSFTESDSNKIKYLESKGYKF